MRRATFDAGVAFLSDRSCSALLSVAHPARHNSTSHSVCSGPQPSLNPHSGLQLQLVVRQRGAPQPHQRAARQLHVCTGADDAVALAAVEPDVRGSQRRPDPVIPPHCCGAQTDLKAWTLSLCGGIAVTIKGGGCQAVGGGARGSRRRRLGQYMVASCDECSMNRPLDMF